jgi:KDO2-lipid IV(A) lauroyltransferase
LKAFIFITILRISQLLSLANSRRIGRFLGKISWHFAHKNRQVTLTNISRCFPELSNEEQTALAKNSINATIMNMMELGKIWDKKLDINTLIEQSSGLDDFKQALSLGKGLLLAVPHMGNWEVLNLVLARFDKYAFLYKAPSDKTLEQKLVAFRGKSNALQIEANLKGVRKIMIHLKDNGFVGILPDQRPKQGQGVFTPFYNIPTYTMSLFSKLAIKTKVPVFFAYALRSDKGFKIYFEQSSEQIYSDLESSVTYMNAKIQEIVDKAPEQYQWTYKRFSIQPDGEQPFYKKRP